MMLRQHYLKVHLLTFVGNFLNSRFKLLYFILIVGMATAIFILLKLLKMQL